MIGRPLEIATLLYSMSLSISELAHNAMLMHKACNLSMPFGNCTIGEANAQNAVTSVNSWKSVIKHAIPIVMIILAGSWSDSHGRRRKPLILLPLIGQMLSDSLCLLNVYFWKWPELVAALVEAVTPGLFGSSYVFWIGLLAYISENSPNELLTLNYGIINSIVTISYVIGTGLEGFIVVGLGFYGAFILPILLNSTAIAIVLAFIKDNPWSYDENVEWLKPRLFLDAYVKLFKSKIKHFTLMMGALLLSQAILVGIIEGEYAVKNLFMRYKFSVYEEKYSLFRASSLLVTAFGTFFSTTVLSHYFKLSDAVIGSIACIFDILSAICYVLVDKYWQLFIIPFLDFFHGTAIAVSISLTTKIVDSSEMGRLNSVRGVITALLSIVIVPLYSAIYKFTIKYVPGLPGAVFGLNIILIFPILIMFVLIYFKCKHLWL